MDYAKLGNVCVESSHRWPWSWRHPVLVSTQFAVAKHFREGGVGEDLLVFHQGGTGDGIDSVFL